MFLGMYNSPAHWEIPMSAAQITPAAANLRIGSTVSTAFFRIATAIALAAALGRPVAAQSFTENFDDISQLAGAGWVMTNASVAVGLTNWFQGSSVSVGGPFDAFNGAANAYIGANYNNATGSNATISNWLMAPNRTLRNGDVLTFFTRTVTNQTNADRLEVRLSSNGASTTVGTGVGTGDFTTLLLIINPTLALNVYPSSWTQYTITLSGLPAPTSGRLAFRYYVTDGGALGANSDYIGIDNVVYSPYVCPSITIAPTTLSGGTDQQAYSAALSQTGALGAPTYAVTAGALPPGLTLSPGGVISGTPNSVGTFNFTVIVSDASGCAGSRAYSLAIGAAAPSLAGAASRKSHGATGTFDLPLSLSP
jgi:Putative Ig domain